MAQPIMVISFDDTERATLGADGKGRSDAAGELSKSISKMIKEVFNDARALAGTYPNEQSLTDMQTRLDNIRAIVKIVPSADGAQDLNDAVDSISGVIESARRALQTMN
ncbi:hypothetical protein [Gordonia aichiensis]|uniref:hypothetical protein n=1 Tax=Gordonia aichiensis TaxID=36820 RepID=UPI003265E007